MSVSSEDFADYSASLAEHRPVTTNNEDWLVQHPTSLNTPISPPRGCRQKDDLQSRHGDRSHVKGTYDGPIGYRTHRETWKEHAEATEHEGTRHVINDETSHGQQDDDEYEDLLDKSVGPSFVISTSQAFRDVNSAAIESGDTQIRDHLTYFTTTLASRLKPYPLTPLLSIPDFKALYTRSLSPYGRHFVIHQHDHPVAGTHYDLRLQISPTSSISFAIMYGLPGNPNSRRLNRNATETRVHNLWNHLIETASLTTGSMLIWDTGEYEILKRRSKYAPRIDPDSADDEEDVWAWKDDAPESAKLEKAFQCRKIRLRLHGTRLPRDYTLNLRLTKEENRTEQPKRPVRKRRRPNPNADPANRRRRPVETPPSSDVDIEAKDGVGGSDDDVVMSHTHEQPTDRQVSAIEKELQEQEDEQVRLTNAYPGATNSIGSIHQRKWFLSVDRIASGFMKTRDRNDRIRWVRKQDGEPGKVRGWDPFYVRGRDEETSVVTGRTADEVMADEGVAGFIGRKGWLPVLW